MNKKTKEKILRVVAMYLALNLLGEFIIPIPAHALTGGPSQPEVESFEPVSTTEMVNLFTGDFNYNIPLLTVPGPNGGYPINLAYHAGIGMEQEASWVGLGWNINPGVINRNMRGLPDDFSGDGIVKKMYYKPNKTWALDWKEFDVSPFGIISNQMSLDAVGNASYYSEILGFNERGDDLTTSFSYQVHYNNYRGAGVGIGMNLTNLFGNHLSPKWTASLSLSYDTDGGLGVSPGISYTNGTDWVRRTYDLGLGYNSRTGMMSLRMNTTKSVVRSINNWDFNGTNLEGGVTNDERSTYFLEPKPGSGIVFCSQASAYSNQSASRGVAWRFGVTIGKPKNFAGYFDKYQKTRFEMTYSATESHPIGHTYPAFGTHYLGNASASSPDDYMLDYARGTNPPAEKNTPLISSCYGSADGLFASGQGVSGAFKLFRSEYGTFSESPITNQFPGGVVQVEFGQDINTVLQTHIGGDYGVNYSQSYSGDWKSQISAIEDLAFGGSELGGPLYEPAYYRSTGEMLASPLTELNNLSGDQAVRFNLRNKMDSEIGIITKVEDELVTSDADANVDAINSNSKRTTRQKRSQLLSYRTSGAIAQTNVGYGRPIITLYDLNDFPQDAAPDTTHYRYSSRLPHHIGEITVTNPDGTRYVYGLPVYNTHQKEVMFTKDGFLENSFDRTETYSAGQDNDIGNSEGNDNLFMSTEIPDYAYGYLVTAIYSADYVDLTGNGPTEDDFGYWVKFNYTPNVDGEYNWRVPYRDASYSKGHISDLKDDKLSYMYGTKEIYYLNSVETKTHEAHFILNDNTVSTELRADANGAMMEDFLGASTLTTAEQQHYLKSIELISKADPATVLKKVHFEYDFSLCGDVDNNVGTTVTVGGDDINAEEGKLTLKRVWFSHLGNEKGQLSPYIFSYDEGGRYDNPDYDLDSMDRWGNFMEGRLWGGMWQVNCNENPYVNQSIYGNHSDEYAGAWNLKKITLPSGGEINVEYESDDYAFVQDQPAMQMQRLVGTGEYTTVTDGMATASGSSLGDRNLLLFFELEETFDADGLTEEQILAHIHPYIQGVDDLYFKTFLKLKKNPGNLSEYSYDYVEGYAQVDWDADYPYGYGTPDGNGIVTTGWVRVKAMERNPWNPIGQTDHPIKLAGWQYLRLERPDLFDDGNLFNNASPNNIPQVIQGFVNIFNDVQRLFGYFNFCQSRGYCNEINITHDGSEQNIQPRPSYLRLNSPDGKKLGGGHRVRSITITDNWDNMAAESAPITASYGTSYEYAMPDGTSSGVAEYEPLIGGDENALKKPLRYEERKFPYRNDGLFVEEPFAEGLYPAPNVGYRRVVVRSINNDPGSVDVTVNRTGVTVTEFYTAKDFPVLADYTDLQKKNFAIPIIIPFIGEISYNNKGYSQGFSLELNNMHGQIKSQAVYGAGADINNSNAQPTSKAEYIYQVDPIGGPNGEPKLSSRVTVLTQDGVYEEADLGKTHEFYIDRQQHSNFSVSAGLQTNAGAVPPYVFWTNVFPYFEISRSMYRSISTMKIIQRNGVLSEVREYKDGAFTVNKTLMYDAETGQPLLTQTINNYNRPVYTYNYASHWAYDGMGPAYKNVGAYFSGVTITSGILPYTNAENYFVPGDEVEVLDGGTTEIVWVSEVDAVSDEVTFIDEAGALVSTGTVDLRIIRSGRRNQQISTNGVIVSLSNPVTERESPFFTAFNAYDASALTTETTLELNDFYTDCFTGDVVDVDLAWNEGTHTLSIFTSSESGSCEAALVFNGETDITNIKGAFGYTLTYIAGTGQVQAAKQALVLNCTLGGTTTCLRSCLDNVLHAEAYRFKDEWTFNYLDFGNPENNAKGLGSEFMADNNYPNPYRFGTAGIWRSEESWLYQVDRKQTTASSSPTQTPGDGTYEHFVLHNWGASLDHATQNPQWTLTNTVTKYDPHGFEVENKSALNIYSSAMYGYGSSMPVAVASNTRYEEMAYEGFEDIESPSTYEADLIPHGHTFFTSINPAALIEVNDEAAHTGNYSLKVASNGSAKMDFVIGAANTNKFSPLADKQYHLSVWVKCSAGSTPYVVVENISESTTLATGTVDMTQSAIDGWRQVNLDFTTDDNADNLRITLDCSHASSGYCYFDDLRIQPFTSGMKTYVYNPLTFWLVAELDDRNYATFYNYDEQGALVQVKKETENGIVTVRSSRSNTKR